MNKDILKAIEIEKVYLEYKLRDEFIFHLIDEIKKCGFDSLDEYFELKKKYQFAHLNFTVRNIHPDRCMAAGWNMLEKKETGIFFVEVSDVVVYSYNTKPYNKEYCQQNNITVYELPAGGGTIVANEGDLQFGLCIPDSLNIESDFILNGMVNILSKYMDNIEIVDNDILLKGKKICGMTFLRHNGMIIFLAHFSFSDNSKLIESICHINEKSEKIPYYITAIDKNVLKSEVIKWLSST